MDLNSKKRKIECIICLEVIDIGDAPRFLPCMHFFHIFCIEKWLKTKMICPTCRIPTFINSFEELEKYYAYFKRQKRFLNGYEPTDDNSIAMRFYEIKMRGFYIDVDDNESDDDISDNSANNNVVDFFNNIFNPQNSVFTQPQNNILQMNTPIHQLFRTRPVIQNLYNIGHINTGENTPLLDNISYDTDDNEISDSNDSYDDFLT